MDEKEFFDNLAPSWDNNEVRSTPERINAILDLMNILPGNSILDLGTGTGVLIPYLAKRIGENGSITAVDYSSGMLQRAMEKYKDISPIPHFLNLDFENENIPDEYDHIILYCVYPHLHRPIDTLKWLKTVNLKPDGKIHIAFPSGPEFINNIHKEKHSESGRLPTAELPSEFLNDNGFDSYVVSSTEDAYLISISK